VIERIKLALREGHSLRNAGDDAGAYIANGQAFANFCTLAGIEPDDFNHPEYVSRAFHAIGSRDDCAQLAFATNWLGKQLMSHGKPHIAVKCFAIADAMLAAMGDAAPLDRVANAIDHGIAFRVLHRYDETEERYEVAAAHMPPDALEARFALTTASAVLGRETGRHGQAVALLKGLLPDLDARRHPRMAGWVVANLAMTEDMPDGHFKRAIDRLERARSLLGLPDGEPARLAEIEQSLALAMIKADDAGGEEVAISALARTAGRPNPDITWRMFELLALPNWWRGNHTFAILLLKLAIDILQLLRSERADADIVFRDLGLRGPVFVYDLAALMLSQKGRFGEAQRMMGLKLADASAAQDPEAPPCTESEERAMHQFREAMARQAAHFSPTTLSHALERIARELEGHAASAAVALTQLNRRLQDEMREAMPVASRRDTLILLCLQSELEVRIVVDGAGTQAVLGPPAQARVVNQLAHTFLLALLGGNSGPRERLGSELAALLLEPVLHQISPEVRRLVICAPGALHGLPWAALPWRDGYLVEYFDLVRAAAPGTNLRRQPTTPMRLLAAGCSASGAPALPHAAAEVRALGADILLDKPQDFTSACLRERLRDASVLHLATHFGAETARLGDSRLILGDGSYITLREFSDMGLSHLDLLVLSTCDSGVAGAMDDARAFAVDHVLLSCRVPSVIGMLFPVADEAMASFMQRLYVRLRRGEDKARAIAAVQGEFLSGKAGDAWRAPFYWAAPVLSGNWLGWPVGHTSPNNGKRNHLRLVTPNSPE